MMGFECSWRERRWLGPVDPVIDHAARRIDSAHFANKSRRSPHGPPLSSGAVARLPLRPNAAVRIERIAKDQEGVNVTVLISCWIDRGIRIDNGGVL